MPQNLIIKKLTVLPQENGIDLLTLELLEHSESFKLAVNGQFTIQGRPVYLFQILQDSPSQSKLQFLAHTETTDYFEHNSSDTQTLQYHPPKTELASLNPAKNLLLLGEDSLQAGYFCPASAPLFQLARLRQEQKTRSGLNMALLASSEGFAFRIKPARFMVNIAAPEAIGSCSLLEDRDISNRLASGTGEIGTLHGKLRDLLKAWLTERPQNQEPWQVFLALANKKGQQQLLTFNGLQSNHDFQAVFDCLN